MARNIVNYTVPFEGRDKGKVYVLTELPADQAESWAMRALLAIMGSGVEMPEGFERTGMAGMAEKGLRALSALKWETAKPLLDEMMQCVQYMPDPTKPHIVRPLMADSDIEEVQTRLALRLEIFKLHTSFFTGAVPSLASLAAAASGAVSPNT